MLDFDQARGWEALEQRLAATDNPRHRALLSTVIEHAKAEAVGDVETLMKTLIADPAYHFWGPKGDIGPKGYDGVRQYYDAFVASGAAILQSVKERIIVDDWSICHEGTLSTILPWQLAKARGYAITDESGHYLVRARVCILWSFDDEARAFGEDSYSATRPDDFERIPDDELPSFYTDYLQSIGMPV
jgi:hypothetical protein